MNKTRTALSVLLMAGAGCDKDPATVPTSQPAPEVQAVRELNELTDASDDKAKRVAARREQEAHDIAQAGATAKVADVEVTADRSLVEVRPEYGPDPVLVVSARVSNKTPKMIVSLHLRNLWDNHGNSYVEADTWDGTRWMASKLGTEVDNFSIHPSETRLVGWMYHKPLANAGSFVGKGEVVDTNGHSLGSFYVRFGSISRSPNP